MSNEKSAVGMQLRGVGEGGRMKGSAVQWRDEKRNRCDAECSTQGPSARWPTVRLAVFQLSCFDFSTPIHSSQRLDRCWNVEQFLLLCNDYSLVF